MARAAKEKTAMRFEIVPVDLLQDHPQNDYSMDERTLEELLESIRRDGLAQPPIVRPLDKGYQIIAGHRRVECYRRLAREDPGRYAQIPANILEDCDDDRALVLMDVTNLMVRQLSVVERSKSYERLWKTVPQLRKKRPDLKGVRTSQVIADIITNETGQAVSRATIDRVLAAGRHAQEVNELIDARKDQLTDAWVSELSNREGFTVTIVNELAARDVSTQDRLLADYRRDSLSPRQLEKLLVHENPKTDADVERTLDGVIRALRDVSAWKKKYGAAVDIYRVDYIRGQLDKLVRRAK